MIEKDFDLSFIADLALREKQIQQNYRPVIAVHKWFARRPGTAFSGVSFCLNFRPPGSKAFFGQIISRNSRLRSVYGRGTPLVEANRVGCDITGFDINPMAYWIVREEIESLNLSQYQVEAKKIRQKLERTIGALYRTKCLDCGSGQTSNISFGSK